MRLVGVRGLDLGFGEGNPVVHARLTRNAVLAVEEREYKAVKLKLVVCPPGVRRPQELVTVIQPVGGDTKADGEMDASRNNVVRRNR